MMVDVMQERVGYSKSISIIDIEHADATIQLVELVMIKHQVSLQLVANASLVTRSNHLASMSNSDSGEWSSSEYIRSYPVVYGSERFVDQVNRQRDQVELSRDAEWQDWL
ncbi:Hypothetical protein POVR2_LOCUS145 [uncultured virus]|nr:Hypothetical protein POVR2_LOCUS145 [uncultured virus]